MNFGFGKAQEMTATAGLGFAAPKSRDSREAEWDNRRNACSIRFNLKKLDATVGMVLRAGRACPDRASPCGVSRQKAFEPSEIFLEPFVAGHSGIIFAEIFEETIILAISEPKKSLLHCVSRRKAPERRQYPSICRENRRDRPVAAVAATAEYVVKDAAQCRELDINQETVSPEKHGVIAASALTRRRR